MRLIVLAILLLASSAFSRPRKSPRAEACGYEACPQFDPDKINIHIVPHTHDDVGWLKTLDQYFYGARTSTQRAGVQYIIDSVIQELLRDPGKRFPYVEAYFFQKWWRRQTPELQDQVKMLVNEGRLEFIGGAWSMNDEAASHYTSTIDQFTWGTKFLNDTFGECGRPRIGWQIDPFGHAREQASLFAQMGYDAMFFARLDYQDKVQRMKDLTPEMIWHGSSNLGEASDLLTGALYNHYSPPPGYCFDILCADSQMIDDPTSEDYNIPERVGEFVEYAKNQSEHYRHNHVLFTMGGDFTYQDAHVYYMNLDKMIKYATELYGDEIYMFYSTPTCYTKALHEANITWPEKSDDFFPYASDPHSYWTGYYTSRPTQKRYERYGNHYLQVCKQLSALAPRPETFYKKNLDKLRSIMGVMQHHDAITGTEKQHVANNYALLMTKALKACDENTNSALRQILETDIEFETCHSLNVSACPVTERQSEVQAVALYNPNGHNMTNLVRVPLISNEFTGYKVFNSDLEEIPFSVIPIPSSVRLLEERHSDADVEVVFHANPVPPLSADIYYIVKNFPAPPKVEWTKQKRGEEFLVGTDDLQVRFGGNGLMKDVTINGETRKFTQNFFWYEGALSNNYESKNRSSGAYIFRPNGTERLVSVDVQVEYIQTDDADEVHQIFSSWLSQVIRIHRHGIEFNWLVGPIPNNDGKGKEIITRYYTDIESNGTFWTDSNGREMIKRVRNFRDTWDVQIEEFESGNYYPVTSNIAIEDENSRFAVLVDRAEGGSSLSDGTIELMVGTECFQR